MFGKRKIFILFAAFLALAAIVVWVKNREPSYQGKTLTEWLEGGIHRGGFTDEAEEAVRAIGADGIPLMMKWFRMEDSRLKQALIDFFDRHPEFYLRLEPADHYWSLAMHELYLLGPRALPVIDELFDLYINPETHERISWAFHYLGPETIPYLLEATKSFDVTIRNDAFDGLGSLRSDGRDAIPELLRLTRDNSTEVRALAIMALAGIAEEAEVVLPRLFEMANEEEEGVKRNAIAALGAYESLASEYAPFLVKTLSDTNCVDAAVFSLSRILPDPTLILTQALTNSEPEIQRAAAAGLEMIPAYQKITDYGPYSNIHYVHFTLYRLTLIRWKLVSSVSGNTPDLKAALTRTLITNLSHSDPEVRFWTARVLGSFTNHAVKALAALHELSDDPDPSVREEAESAFRKIAISQAEAGGESSRLESRK